MGYRAGLGWPPPHKPVLSLKYRVFGQHDSNCKQFCYYIRLRSETPPPLSHLNCGGGNLFSGIPAIIRSHLPYRCEGVGLLSPTTTNHGVIQ